MKNDFRSNQIIKYKNLKGKLKEGGEFHQSLFINHPSIAPEKEGND